MSMEYVNLGKTGLKVSRICLGCMTYGELPAVIRRPPPVGAERGAEPALLRQALDLGINFFDTANVYSSGDSERVGGQVSEGEYAAREPW